MSAQYRLDTDLNEAVKMANALEDYVRGNELYGNAGGGFFSKMPALTIGALAMRLHRLHALEAELSAPQRAQLHQAQAQYDSTAREWRVHFEEKARREATSRVDAMSAFFQESKQNPRSAATNYLPEASRRTIIQALLPVLDELGGADSAFVAKLKSADTALRALVQPCDFLWASPLQAVYSPQVYWWLYHRPQ
jgi:uncharacterized membrane-anchored protein YhcB (DUF1043 family)